MTDLDKNTYIRNVYVSLKQATPYIAEHILVIETELELPQSRFAEKDERIEDLLLELHALKADNPTLFATVDTVEIRGPDHHMDDDDEHIMTDEDFAFLRGARVPSFPRRGKPGDLTLS